MCLIVGFRFEGEIAKCKDVYDWHYIYNLFIISYFVIFFPLNWISPIRKHYYRRCIIYKLCNMNTNSIDSYKKSYILNSSRRFRITVHLNNKTQNPLIKIEFCGLDINNNIVWLHKNSPLCLDFSKHKIIVLSFRWITQMVRENLRVTNYKLKVRFIQFCKIISAILHKH